jgi:uncharacterized protein YjbI with pentapeptide repeats
LEVFVIDEPLQNKVGKTELPTSEFWLTLFELVLKNPFKAFCKTLSSGTVFHLVHNFEKTNELFNDALKNQKLVEPGEAYAFLILNAYGQGFQTALSRISTQVLDKNSLSGFDWKNFDNELDALSKTLEKFIFSQIFESNPRAYPPIPDIGKFLLPNIQKIGLDINSAKSFVFSCENLFLSNLFNIVITNSSRYRSFLIFCRSNIKSAQNIEKDLASYLKSLVSYKVFINNFENEVYIKPLAEFWPNPGTGMTKDSWAAPCFLEDAQTCMDEWLQTENSTPFFLIIGGPGSGKTVLIKKWAAALSSPNNPFGNYFPIIVPASSILSSKGPVTGVIESLQSQGFFNNEHPRLLPPNRKTVLILEYVEDIWLNSEPADTLNLFIRKVNQLIEDDTKGNLRITITSHSIPAEQCAEALGNKALSLSLLPFKFDVRRTRVNATKSKVIDNRVKWQIALQKNLGIDAENILSKIQSPLFEDISSNPWMNHTLVDILLNESMHNADVNDIYERIISRLYNLTSKFLKQSWPLREKEYFRILEEIAVACGINGGTATLENIRDRIASVGRLKTLESLNKIFSCEDPLLGLMTTCFFEQEYNESGERVFKIPYPNLQKYLTARCLSDTAWQMGVQTTRHENSEGVEGWDLKKALIRWIKLTGPIPLDIQISRLLQGEKKRFRHDPVAMKTLQTRFGFFLSEALRNALPIRDTLDELKIKSEPETLDHFFSNTTTVLLAFASHLGEVNQVPTKIDWKDPQGFISLLKRIALDKKLSDNLLFRFLNHLDFSRQKLTEDNQNKKLDFSRANFSGASFKYADLSESIFQETNFSGANFSMANLSGGDFQGADLRGVDFGSAILHHANFNKAVLDEKNYKMAAKKNGRVRGAIVVKLASKHLNSSHQAPVRLEETKNRSSFYNAQDSFID